MTAVTYFNAIDAEVAPANSNSLVVCAYDGTACSVPFSFDGKTEDCDSVHVFVKNDADDLMQYAVSNPTVDVVQNTTSGNAISNRVSDHGNKVIALTVCFLCREPLTLMRSVNTFVAQLSKPIDTFRIGHLYLFFSCRLSDVDYSYSNNKTYCEVNLTVASNYPFCLDGRYNTTIAPNEWGMLADRSSDGTFTPPSWYSTPVFLFDDNIWTHQLQIEQFTGNFIGEKQNSSTYYAKIPIGLNVFSSVLFPLAIPGVVESGAPIVIPTNDSFKPAIKVTGLTGGNLAATVVLYRIYF